MILHLYTVFDVHSFSYCRHMVQQTDIMLVRQ